MYVYMYVCMYMTLPLIRHIDTYTYVRKCAYISPGMLANFVFS